MKMCPHLIAKSKCKICVRARKAKWRAENPEKMKAACAKWRAENPEKMKAARDKWYAANRDRERANNAKRRAENPLQYRMARLVRNANCSARRAGVDGTFDPLDFLLLCVSHGWRCYICNEPLTWRTVTPDHMVPFSWGRVRGCTNTINNISPCCELCNERKRNRFAVREVGISAIAELATLKEQSL
jgi:hypothetical protein